MLIVCVCLVSIPDTHKQHDGVVFVVVVVVAAESEPTCQQQTQYIDCHTEDIYPRPVEGLDSAPTDRWLDTLQR